MSRISQFILLVLLSTPVLWSQQSARIFVYAPLETGTRSWQPVWCDGDLVAKIKRGTFFTINVAPGRHVLKQSNGVPSFVEVGLGDEKYMRLDLQIKMGQPAVPVFAKVDTAVASNELRFVSYIEGKQVLAVSVAKRDPREQPGSHLKVRSQPQ